jgi:hypothetical protein
MKKKCLLISILSLLITLIFSVNYKAFAADDVANYYDNEEVSIDYAYSFAVIGDTQSLCELHSKHMNTMYQWIIDNKESKKIEFVFGLGDITEGDNDWEWVVAKDAIYKMNGVVPYSLIRGNHDTSRQFYKTFGEDKYMDQFIGFYKDGSLNSSYRTLTVGETDYLFLTLDFGPDDAELNWAASVIEAYPNHKVVISTHSYIARDGSIVNENSSYFPEYKIDDDKPENKEYNHGELMWNKLIRKYGNIVLVLSGHDSSSFVKTVQSVGDHGNTVTQMLIDPQSMDKNSDNGLGMVCMLYFSKDGSKMEVEFYSTVREQYYHKANHYVVDISNHGNQAHNFNYSITDDSHSWECVDCGATSKGAVPHVFENDCDSECDHCKAKRNVSHSFTKVNYNDEKHYLECSKCGIVDNHSYKQHLYDNDCDSECNYCANLREVSHIYDKFNSDCISHWYECSNCGEIDFYSQKPHNYDHACDTDCNDCGYIRTIVHNYSTTKKDGDKYYKECNICGEKVDTKTPEMITEEGCSGSIGTSMVGVVVLLTSVMVIKHRKKEEN